MDKSNKMNGIYIKGISMPNGGTLKIEIGFDADGHPMALTENYDVFDVVPVPPHGDLIDKEALMKETENDAEYLGVWRIDDAPVIIPADKEH